MSSDDMINSEMTDGYRDGLDPDSPAPSANRTQPYCCGFLNGRDDLRRKPRVLGDSMGAPALSRLVSPAFSELVSTSGEQAAARDAKAFPRAAATANLSRADPAIGRRRRPGLRGMG